MPIFDEEDSKLVPFTTIERMVSGLGIQLTKRHISTSGFKYTAKFKSQERTMAPSINYKSGEWICSCEDFHYSKRICKHDCALLFYVKKAKHEHYLSFLKAVGKPEFQRFASIKPTGFISFQMKTLDGMTKGGLPLSIVTGYVGDPKIGKTWLAYQTGVACNLPKEKGGLEKPVLYLNVEADFLKPGVQERFYKFFKERFKTDFVMDFLFPRSIHMLFDLFGLGLNLKKTEKRVVPSVWDDTKPLDSPIAALLRRRKYGLIVVDSMTSPLKREVPVPPNQNISSRAACMNTLWGRFENVVENFGCAMIVTHHCTKNPTTRSFGSPYGGDSIMYNMKHVLHILNGTKALFDNYGQGARRILRSRWPGLLPTQIPANLAPNMGFVDAE